MVDFLFSEESDILGVIQVVQCKITSVKHNTETVSKGHENTHVYTETYNKEILEIFDTNKAGCFVYNSQFQSAC